MNIAYILRCNDGTLYTGSTVDMAKRLREHNGILKNGAKYTRGRRPVVLVYEEECESISHARTREVEIKRLTREGKLNLLKKHESGVV